MTTSFFRFPLLVLSMFFAAGILAAKCLTVDWRFVALVCGTAAIAALVLQRHAAATLLVCAAFAAAGMLALYAENASIRSDRIKVLYDSGVIGSGAVVDIEGVLGGRPEAAFDGEFLTIQVEKLWQRGEERNVSGNVRIFVPGRSGSAGEFRREDPELHALKYGSRIRVACRLEREDEYLNPGVITRSELLDRQGIDATATLKSARLIEHIADESVFLPLAVVYDQRARLIDTFRRNLGPSAAGVMIASLLGNKHFLDKDTADLFREGGTFHILVISGLHITFIGGLLLILVRSLTRDRWLQFGITVAALWAYTLAVGADVPVVRASVMFTVVLFSYAIYRRSDLLNSLGLCALILLVWRPSDLFNPSFQLTFVSVAAIVSCAYPLIENLRAIGTWTPTAARPFPPNVPIWLRRFCEAVYWNIEAWAVEARKQIWTARPFKMPYGGARDMTLLRSGLRFTFEAVAVSLIVQLWMLPLSVVYFHRVSISGVLLNVWVGFFIAAESFAAVIGAVVAQASNGLSRPFFLFAEISNWGMLALPRLFADNGWTSFRLPAYTGRGIMVYAAYALVLVFFAAALAQWKPFALDASRWPLKTKPLITAATLAGTLLAVVVLHPLSDPPADGRLHIDHFDVGQGDAALVTFPTGETLLVDGGGTFDYRKDDDADRPEPDTMSVGEAVVSQALWHRGLSHIDHILTTHADADHVGGLVDVAKNFDIGSAIFGRMPADDEDLTRLANVLDRRGIPVERIGRGDRFSFGDVLVEVLHPLHGYNGDSPSDNDHSVVLRLVYGSRSFLLTGDIESAAEQALLSGGGTLRADVVKVPHHGSRTSSTEAFVDAVGAEFAVISVGRSSPFGHPHADVVDRWKRSGAQVLTTGTSGMLSISTDGRDLRIDTYK